MNGPLAAVAGRCTSPLSPRSVNWRATTATARAPSSATNSRLSSQRALPKKDTSAICRTGWRRGRPLLNGERSRLLRAVEVAAERVGARLVDLAHKLTRLTSLDRALCGRQVVLRVVLPVRPRYAHAVDELILVLDVDPELLAGRDLKLTRLEADIAHHDIDGHIDGLLGAGRRRRRRFLRHRLAPDHDGALRLGRRRVLELVLALVVQPDHQEAFLAGLDDVGAVAGGAHKVVARLVLPIRPGDPHLV